MGAPGPSRHSHTLLGLVALALRVGTLRKLPRLFFSILNRRSRIIRSQEDRVGMLHWLILLPYYFVATLAALPFLMLACRLLRVRLPINSLVGGAIALTVTGIVLPLACNWVDLSAFTGRPLLLLLLLSFVFAATDAALAARLPLPLDHELQEL